MVPACPTPPHKQKREHRSRALVFLHHCGGCGKIGHKTPTCPVARDQALSTEVVAATKDIVLTGKEKRLAKVVAHLKYVWPEQRTAEYEARPTKKSRGVTELSLVAVARMSAQTLCGTALEAGLLIDLKGTPCPNTHCEKSASGVGAGRHANHQAAGLASCHSEAGLLPL